MKILNFDTGIQEFAINDTGVLRFNPSDPNVYNRFFETQERIEKIVQEYTEKELEAEGTELDEKGWAMRKELAFIREADSKVKAELAYVFGQNNNDFETIFGGVNLLAMTKCGKRVIENFFEAILPVVENGLQNYTETEKNNAVRTAKLNREQRRSLK